MSFDVGERIREFRKQAGLNQDQLAELSSLNRVTVAKYESKGRGFEPPRAYQEKP